MSTLNIENIKYSLYQKSELLWWISLVGWLIAVCSSILSIIIDQKDILVLLGVVSFLTPFGIVWLRELAAEYSFRANKCRRLILYSDGLGAMPSDTDLLCVKGYALGEKIESAYYEPPYYASTLEAGPARLLDIIGESAFFTKELSKKVATKLNIVLVVILIILMVLGLSSRFWMGFIVISEKSLIDFIEAFTLFIVTLVAGDIYLIKAKYSKLADDSDKVFDAAFKVKNKQELSLHDVITIASDYDACVQASPPIPTIVYKRFVSELNAIYKDVSK